MRPSSATIHTTEWVMRDLLRCDELRCAGVEEVEYHDAEAGERVVARIELACGLPRRRLRAWAGGRR